MGIGYATLMYDPDSIVSTGLGDIAACRYDGVEIGLPKIEEIGLETLRPLLDEYDLDLYCVMAGWLNTEADVRAAVGGVETAASLGADFLGILPPPRGIVDDSTFATWLDEIGTVAADVGVTPLVHHHAGAHVEQADEIRRWLNDGPDGLRLVFDTAHYHAYGDVVEGIQRFADDIAYVHFKDIDPPSDFETHVENLSAGKVDYDSIVTYFGSFTDLGDGVLDFAEIRRALDDIGYDGHRTVEIENQHSHPLVHAKRNVDHLRAATDR
jgi:inosose dehydratase